MRFIDSLFGKKKETRLEDGNPELVRAMEKVASNDGAENRRKLYETLLGSMLLVPVPEIPAGLAPGLHTATKETRIQLTAVADRNQVRVTSVFTDLEALRNWDPNTPYLGLKAQELFRLVMGTDIQAVVINPFDPIRKMIRPGGRVTRPELELLSKGLLPGPAGPRVAQFQINAGEKVAMGRPARPPSSAIEELLRSQATSFPAIAELYVFQIATQASSSHTVIGISLSEDLGGDQQEEIVRRMGISVRPELEPNQSLDFMFLRGSARDQVRALGTLIFRRP
ncbi:MAG: SseB family protein [Candidatus Sulfotelmatobacter sp.]|jgi:hypothetical protein